MVGARPTLCMGTADLTQRLKGLLSTVTGRTPLQTQFIQAPVQATEALMILAVRQERIL